MISMSTSYPDPVVRLLTYGDCRNFRQWPNYLDLGLTREQIPDLIRMATDPELNWADSESLEVWAPIHAWRALGQLQAEEAMRPLMELFQEVEESDWVIDELPEVYGMIGPQAIPPLAQYLFDSSHGTEARITAGRCLERIGSMHPDAREECVSVLTRELRRFQTNEPDLNGCLISDLIDLKAVESISVIREAFAHDRVDLFISGDVEDVEIELGLRAERATPAPRFSFFPAVPRARAKVGRNDPCPCGSGKKYKKCCLGK
jgi:HEAT repeat protein